MKRYSALIFALVAAGCTSEKHDANQANGVSLSTIEAGQFTDEDKRVTRLLSVGNNRALAQSDTPYDEALLCSLAIDSMSEVLNRNNSLPAEQLTALGQAIEVLRSRVQAFGRDLGKEASEIEADREAVAEQVASEQERAQIAIGCVRRFQETGTF
jgi:hypothetical protein